MSTLTNLTALGVKDQEIRQGEVVELDVLDLKAAKKEKWSEVTNAEDSADVIAAYAGDLADTLRANDELESERDELTQHVNHLSQENGQLNEALQTGHIVDRRIDEFTSVMDEMESNLNALTQRKHADDMTMAQLKEEVESLRARNQELEDTLTSERVGRESTDSRIQELEARVAEQDEIIKGHEDHIEQLTSEIDKQGDDLVQYDKLWDALERDVNKVMENLYNRAREAGVQFEE